MPKAKLGVLLAGGYALGLAVLVAVALIALHSGAFSRTRTVLRHLPESAQRAARTGQVAVRAGALGLKHLPAAIESHGPLRRQGVRLCSLDRAGGCGSNVIRLRTTLPVIAPIRILTVDDEG